MFSKYEKLKDSSLSIFKLDDISMLLNLSKESARVIANRMVKKRILVRLKRDLYILKDKEIPDFFLANVLLEPSYISFESALNYWGITTQIPSYTTSASLRSKRIIILDKEFSYSLLPRELFYFGIIRENGISIASAPKSFLDMCYFATFGKKSISFDDFYLDKLDRNQLKAYVKKYPQKTRKIVKELLPWT